MGAAASANQIRGQKNRTAGLSVTSTNISSKQKSHSGFNSRVGGKGILNKSEMSKIQALAKQASEAKPANNSPLRQKSPRGSSANVSKD